MRPFPNFFKQYALNLGDFEAISNSPAVTHETFMKAKFCHNSKILTFPKNLPNGERGEDGDPRLESEAKFRINFKGDEENGELLWIGV